MLFKRLRAELELSEGLWKLGGRPKKSEGFE